MAVTNHIDPKSGDVLVLLGTVKGSFLLKSDRRREGWELGGPHFPGENVNAMAWDGRAGRTRLWASPLSWHFGGTVRRSDDFGRTWTDPEKFPIRFPEGIEASVKNVWQIMPGRAAEPEVIYAGAEPASLFRSTDGGDTWSLVRGLWDNPHRPKWEPGGGGLCLHTIVPDPEDPRRITVAISTGGVYRSDDGGETWKAKSQGVRAQFMPEGQRYPAFGQCVHKVVSHPKRPARMFLQNHWGLYRSDDAGDSWTDIANGVPSDFGFAMAVHPQDPATVFIVPLESDGFRCTPEGRLRVYRSKDAGASWEALTKGLPQEHAFETVLRDGMSTDGASGIYFGTRSGKVWGSQDGGDSWRLLADGLPAVTCVKTATIA